MRSPNCIYNFIKKVIHEIQNRTKFEKINSAGGTALVGALLDKSRLNETVDAIQTGKGRPIFSNSLIVRSYLGLLCQGRTSFDDLNIYKKQ